MGNAYKILIQSRQGKYILVSCKYEDGGGVRFVVTIIKSAWQEMVTSELLTSKTCCYIDTVIRTENLDQ
jgi:hypothetical protein